MTSNKTPNHSQKPEWFELTENQTPSAGLRKINKVLPITILAVAGGLLLGGSFFANAESETSAPTQISAATISVPKAEKTMSSSNGLSVPVAHNIVSRGDDSREGREHEGREHEGRERGDDD